MLTMTALFTFILVHVVLSNSIDIPLTNDGVQAFLTHWKELRESNYRGESTTSEDQQIFHQHVMICADNDNCFVGFGKQQAFAAQMISYIKGGWMTTTNYATSLVSINKAANSFVIKETAHTSTSFTIPGFYNGEYDVQRGRTFIFDEQGKLIKLLTEYEGDTNWATFRTAFSRLFNGMTTKQQAENEQSILFDPNTDLFAPEHTKLFGFFDRDVFIVLSGLSAIITLAAIAIYICSKSVCCLLKMDRKKIYFAVEHDDVEIQK
eukprot:67854_1